MLKRTPFAALVALVASVVLFGHEQPPAHAALASHCRQVVVTDAASGQRLRGVEDIAVNATTRVAYLSADDRWAVEERAAQSPDALPQGGIPQGGIPQDGIPQDGIPQGGIYVLPLDDDSLRSERIDVTDATTRFKLQNALHPHGIDLVFDAKDKGTLYVINRRRERHNSGGGSGEGGGQWKMVPTVEVFDVGEAGELHHRRTVRDQAFCRANGIAGLGRWRFLVSNDGAACGRWGRRLEQIFDLKRGNVVLVELDDATEASTIRPVAGGIGFANGLAVDAQHFYVAATRDQALLVYRIDSLNNAATPAEPERAIAVDGGPDNLSWASEHVLLMAVHPSLLRLAGYRYRWVPLMDTAPTRIIGVDVRDGAQGVVYASDAGEPLSAATIAVAYGNSLIAGSVTDEGLMLCHLSEPGG